MNALAKAAELGRDPARAVDQRFDHEFGGFIRIESWNAAVELRRRDHLRAHEGHVHIGERNAAVEKLARRAVRPRLQRRLRGDVG